MRTIESLYVSDDGKRRIRVENDDSPESPRDWDNQGTMVCWHDRYMLGDEHLNCSPSEFLLGMAAEYSPTIIDRIDKFADKSMKHSGMWTGQQWDEYARMVREYQDELVSKVLDKHYIILPLYLYDHSGMTMRTGAFSCSFDSGQVGFIYVSKESIRLEHGWTNITHKRHKLVEKWLEGEVEVYDQFLTGEVYGFVCERLMPCPDDWDEEEWAEHDCHWEEEESCWGFFGMDIIKNGILDHIDDEFIGVFCESEGISLDQLKKEQQEWADKVES